MKKLLRKLRAKLNKTFVADCPKCHKHFYGHSGYGQQVKIKNEDGKDTHYRYICHSCLKEHKGM